jgi:hypothetical protein
VIIPRNNTSDANAAGSFNTDLTMTSLAGTEHEHCSLFVRRCQPGIGPFHSRGSIFRTWTDLGLAQSGTPRPIFQGFTRSTRVGRMRIVSRMGPDRTDQRLSPFEMLKIALQSVAISAALTGAALYALLR